MRLQYSEILRIARQCYFQDIGKKERLYDITICHGVCMRTLDRALYRFSQSGAAFALKTITDEMLFLELALRGYDLSKLLDEETAGKIVKLA